MDYVPNIVDWPVGSFVLQEADAKEPTMLMQVVGKSGDRYVTRYVHPRFSLRFGQGSFKRDWSNGRGSLLDPAPFGISVLPVEDGPIKGRHHVEVIAVPSRCTARYADGAKAFGQSYASSRIITLPKGAPAPIGIPNVPVPATTHVSGTVSGIEPYTACRFFMNRFGGMFVVQGTQDGRTWTLLKGSELNQAYDAILADYPQFLMDLVRSGSDNRRLAMIEYPPDCAWLVDLAHTGQLQDDEQDAMLCSGDSPFSDVAADEKLPEDALVMPAP